MKRELWLMQKNIEELFELYYDETTRINKEDAKITQDAVKNEILKRIFQMYKALEDDVNKREDVHKTYQCLFFQPALKSRDDDVWRR